MAVVTVESAHDGWIVYKRRWMVCDRNSVEDCRLDWKTLFKAGSYVVDISAPANFEI